MSDHDDAAKALEGFVEIGNEDPRVQEFAQSVFDAVGVRPAPHQVGDRLVLFVSTGDMPVTPEFVDAMRQRLVEQLPELDEVIIVPGQSTSIHRVGGPLR